MAYIMLQQPERTKTGFEEFSAAAQPYLQMAFEYLMKKKLAEPGEKRAQAQEQRELEKEKREALTSVSKGEIPISTIPESIKSSIIRGPKIDTTGLAGRTAELANLPSSAQISGRPEFMRRVTPAETPEEAQARLMGSYAQQQQAINPYKALQAGKLDLWNKAVSGELLSDTEKMLLGVQAKEDPEKLRLFNMLFPQLAQNAEPVISPQSGVDEFGFKPGETRKGYKYIGNNKWQKY